MKTKQTTKHALWASVTAIALCVAMLVGTTFAWFTDTATASVNKIQSGTLKVDIIDAETNASIKGAALSFLQNNGESSEPVASESILWEPGATFRTQSFKIKNGGNLALKYKMVINGATGDTQLLDVITFSLVKVSETDASEVVDLNTFEGHLTATEPLSDPYYIQGTMATTAGNEYQGLTVTGLGLTVYATQDTVEFDSTTNQYDENATYPVPVTTADELTSAVAEGKSVLLNQNIALTDTLTIPAGETVVFDLNGKTLTDSTENGMEVNGTLVIDGEGTVSLTGNNGSINVVEDATLVVNSGKVESTSANAYAVYCKDNGTAIVNGGEIVSEGAPLTGNNTTGNMNFIVNGGTLTAKNGPAIYMPGQCELTITGGTLNGGISLRMGQVNISGGTINATPANWDAPAAYYDYSGNAWLPDALYVFGGTYTSNDATYGNSLNLNITGGTFNCTNGVGSAVAIYDLGKVEQTMNVNISGATLTTNATGRTAAQVLSLSDIGVTTPKAGYGVYSGNVNFTVK